MAQILATVRARVGRLLARRQLEPADDTAPADPLAEASPVLASPRSGGRLRVIATIQDPAVVRTILAHPGLPPPTEPPGPAPPVASG